jgi:hypothetical protein
MHQLTIKKNGQITHGPSCFETREELDAHLASHIEMGSYGKAAWSEEVEDKPAVYQEQDGEQVEIQPATFKTINHPAEYEVVIEDTTEQEAAAAQQKAIQETGKLIQRKCQEALEYITGFNATRGLTFEQIDQMEEEFGDIYSAISKNRIDKAVMLLGQVTPDGTLVTEEFIQTLLQKLDLSQP